MKLLKFISLFEMHIKQQNWKPHYRYLISVMLSYQQLTYVEKAGNATDRFWNLVYSICNDRVQ